MNAVDRLKDKFPESVTWQDLVSFTLSAYHTQDDHNSLRMMLSFSSKVDKEVLAESELYKFRPMYGIAGPDDMLRYLQSSDAVAGLRVGELKDVWTTAEEDITALEKKHKLIVTRNKKDGMARHIWLNDPTMYARVDDEFRDIWLSIPLPAPEQIRRELADTGFKVATEAPKVNAPTRVEKKKKKSGKKSKVTNIHMQGLFKDYSHQRPAAAK